MPFYNSNSAPKTPNSTRKAAASVVNKHLVDGRYKIVQLVGEGSQGKVYKVEDSHDNHKIKALKEVRVMNLKEFDAAFRESNILRKLNSEFIVKYLEYYDDLKNNYFYLLTEFYEDGTLDQLIIKKRKLNETLSNDTIMTYCTQILKAIDCLHDNLITHRDLKPANVFLHKNKIVLGDLGLARDAEMMSRTSLAKGVGTVSYMAPELFSELNYNDKIDIWAYGCILYEMIRGKALFEGTIWRILNSINNFNSERTLNIEGVPEIFKNLLKRAIVKCSQKRATAKELLDIILEKNVPKQEIILVNNLTYQTPRSRQGGSIDKLINVFQQQPKKNSIPSLSSINNPVTDSPYNINSLQISTNDILISGSADKTIKFWNIQTGQCVRTLNGHENDVRCFQMVGNEILLSGSDDKTIKVWLVKTFELMNTMTGHNGSVYCLQLIINRSTKETLVLSGSADETIKIWRFKTGQCLVTLRGHEDSVKSIQVVSEDIIISGSDDKTIRIWSIKQEKCLRTVTTRQYITCLEVLSNDTLISGSWDCTIQLWSIKTGDCIKTLMDHKSYITCLQALSNDCIISGSRDATIKIWNINSGECINTLSGHESTIFCLRITLFKDILFSGSCDTIKMWSIKTGKCIKTLSGHSDYIRHESKPELLSIETSLNKLCDYADIPFNNSDALKEILNEWKVMKPRYDKCYFNNVSKNLYLTVKTSHISQLNDLNIKQIKSKNYQTNIDLYKISIDIDFLKSNLKLNQTPICEAYRFDRIPNDDRYRFRVGVLHKFETTYDYDLIVNEHGLYHIYCKNNNSDLAIFNDVKLILPVNMSLLTGERQTNIEMEKKLLNRIQSNLPLVVNKPIKHCKSNENIKNDKMSVFILGLDSVSLNHFKRMFPKTFEYLSKNLTHNTIFEHHHSVAENTLGNLISLFSGVISEKNQDLDITPEFDEYMKLDDTYCDTIPFVWKDYERLGYLSWLSEDYAYLGMFQYLRKGFRYKPSSVYLLPFWMVYEDTKKKGDEDSCRNNKHSFNIQFDNLNQFFQRMNSNEANKKMPYFGFHFMKYFTHDFFTFPSEYDERLKETLETNEKKGYFENTLFIMMSDHGSRVTGYSFVTDQGRTERTLPFLSIRLPKRLWNTNYETNLISNKNKLTTHFDLFKTLRHFYYINSNDDIDPNNAKCRNQFKNSFKNIQGLRGISLLEQIPNSRSCLDALIPNVYCTCNQRADMNETEFFADTGQTYEIIKDKSMNAINSYANSFRSKCALFKYVKLLTAQKKSFSSMFFYEFRYKVEPGEAIFAVYYRIYFYNVKKEDQKLEQYLKVVRLSRYGNQSKCMSDKNLMGYCFCI